MKVYVVSRHIDYEGSDLIGVFSTQEKAEQVVDAKEGGNWGGIHYDWDEWEVE